MSIRYIPSGTSTSSIIQNLNNYTKTELALPGNWSSNIFYSDLRKDPVLNKKLLVTVIEQANINPLSYLSFFEQTRGYEKNLSDFHKKIYSLFEYGSIMLYFEDYFIRLLAVDKPSQYDEIVIKYIEVLGRNNIGQWDDIVSGIGACCYYFFAKEPELYACLVYRSEPNCPENMTDFELLSVVSNCQSSSSLPQEQPELVRYLFLNKYNDRISVQDSRSDLIQLYQKISK